MKVRLESAYSLNEGLQNISGNTDEPPINIYVKLSQRETQVFIFSFVNETNNFLLGIRIKSVISVLLTEVTEVFASVLHDVDGPDELEDVHGETEVLRLQNQPLVPVHHPVSALRTLQLYTEIQPWF